MTTEKTLIQIKFSAQGLDKLKQIQEHKDISTISETIRYCVSEKYEDIFLNHNFVAKQRLNQKAEARANPQLILTPKEKKEIREKEVATNICLNQLEGKIVTDAAGNPACEYIQYEEMGGRKVNQYTITDSLAFISEQEVHRQYKTMKGIQGAEGKAIVLESMKFNEAKA